MPQVERVESKTWEELGLSRKRQEERKLFYNLSRYECSDHRFYEELRFYEEYCRFKKEKDKIYILFRLK